MNTFRLYFSLATAFFLAIASQSSAQPSPRLWLGVHGGIDIASFSYDPEITSSDPNLKITNGSRTGIAAGAEVNYWFTDNLGICGQLSYVQKGGTQDISFTIFGQEITGSSEATFSYLQIPVLFKARFGDGSVKPFIIIGPEIGIKLSASQTVTSDGQDTTMDIPDSEITSTNFGALFGAGITYQLNPTTEIYLSGAYNYGFTNLNPGPDGGGEEDQKAFSRDIRVSVGILFALGRRKETSPHEE